jgi:AcrR family transcriptional regulator
VSRATIYRNWPESADLVSALLEQESVHEPPGPLGADPAKELTDLTVEVADRVADPDLTALLLAGVESGRRSDHAAQSTREFLNGMFAPLMTVLVAAVDAGVVEGEPTELLADLVGPLLGDLLIGRKIDGGRAREVTSRFVASHRPRGRPARRHTTRNGPPLPSRS